MLICDFDNFKTSDVGEWRQDISPMNDKNSLTRSRLPRLNNFQRRQQKPPNSTESEVGPIDKTLELKPVLHDKKDRTPRGLTVQKQGGLSNMSGRFDESVNRDLMDEVWADLDDVSAKKKRNARNLTNISNYIFLKNHDYPEYFFTIRST